MPWKTIKRDCKQATGKKGGHVVVKKKKDGGTEQESCHTSEEKAKSAIRARHTNEGRIMRITKRQLRNLIKEAIQGTGAISKEPYLDLVMRALATGNPQGAASSVMDSFFIDDVFPEEEYALVDALGALSYSTNTAEVEAVADQWLEDYRAGRLRS